MPSAKFIVPVFCLASALTASAGTATFVTSGAWETVGNWAAAGGASRPPGPADAAAFSGTRSATLNDTAKNVLSLTVSGTANITMSASATAGTVNVGGGALQVGGTLTLDKVSLIKTSDGLGTISLTANTLDLKNGGALVLGAASASGNLSTAAARSWTSSVGGGSITFGSASDLTLGPATSQGDNAITVGSGVTFSGQGTLRASRGTLDVGSSVGSLSGTINFSDAVNSATIRNSGTMSFGALTVNETAAGGTDAIENTGILTLGGAGVVALNGGANYSLKNSGTLNIVSGNAVTINAPIVQSAGTLSLQSPTLALGGTLTVNGGSVIGNATGTTGTGAATFNSGSALNPGSAGVGNLGTIHFPSTLTLASGSTLTIDINSNSGYDRVTAGGAANYSGSTLALSANGAVTGTTVFDILSGASLGGGTFSGLAEGATISSGGYSFTVNYGTVHANTVTLTAVPEPQMYAGAAGLGLLGFAAWRRSQKRA